MNDTVMEQRTRAFPLGPDNATLFLGRYYRRALLGLREDLRQRSRLLCLVGPGGVGKSMLLRNLRGQLPLGYVGEISQPPLGGLLSRLADGLGMKVTGEDEAAVQRRFQQFFATTQTQDVPVIQIIDDAETLKPPDIALLQRLFDPVNGQILLVGQPELLALFSPGQASRELRRPDRIYHLDAMSNAEVGDYIRHRLHEAGFDQELFTPEAIEAVYQYCGGLPRLINLLCFTALASSEFDTATCVDDECIHAAARQRMQTGSYPFLCSPAESVFRCSLKQKTDKRGNIQYDPPIFRNPAQGHRSPPERMDEESAGRFGDDAEDEQAEPAFAHKVHPTQTTRRDAYRNDIDPIVMADNRDSTANTFVRGRPGRMLLLLAAGLLAGFVVARSPLMESSESGTHDDKGAVSSSTFAPYLDQRKTGVADTAERRLATGTDPDRATGTGDAIPEAVRNAATSMRDGERQANENEVKQPPASTATAAASGKGGDGQAAETAKDRTAVAPIPPAVAEHTAPIAARAKDVTEGVGRGRADKAPPEEENHAASSGPDEASGRGMTISLETGRRDEAAEMLTMAQREHIAALYADRAQYEKQAGRLKDAKISVRRGLEMAPNDPRLQALSRAIFTALETPDGAWQQAENEGALRQQPLESPSPLPAMMTPAQDKITHLYMQRAEYEWRNQRLRDALVSIGYGLEEDPNNSALLDMREKVLTELNKRR